MVGQESFAQDDAYTSDRLAAVKREQTPQAVARVILLALFMALWGFLFVLHMPMPRPFLVLLALEMLFFAGYLRVVPRLRSEQQVRRAHYVMLAVETVFHTTMVYFLGGLTWLGPFAYVFGMVFTCAYLDLKRGGIYTTAVASAFIAMVILDGTGTIPHQPYLDTTARWESARFVVTGIVGSVGVFFSLYLWVNWVGHQLRAERDGAVKMQRQLADARRQVEMSNVLLEARVEARTAQLQDANEALHSSEELMRATIESTGDGIIVFDGRGRVRHANARIGEIWGFPAELLRPGTSQRQILGFLVTSYENGASIGAELQAIGRAGGVSEGTLHLPDGRVLEHYSRPLENGDEQEGRVWSFRDVTARTLAEVERERLTAIVEATTDLVSISAADGTRLYMNAAGQRMLGIGEDEVEATRVDDNRPDWAREELRTEGMEALERYGLWIDESAYISADGSEIPVSQVMLAHRSETGDVDFYSVIARDISERKRTEEQLVRLANQDPLTGLFNRRRFVEELDRQLGEACRYGLHGALLFFDLDQFKDVNDSRGHRAGDELLAGLATLLREQLRATDIIGRLGGDEFAVLLPRTSAETARTTAAALLERIRAHTFTVGGAPLRVTASMGVAAIPDGSERSDEILSRADLAMYRAKEEGRNRFSVFEPDGDWQAQIESRIGWNQRIREALEHDRFVLYAQPILDIEDGAVTRYELLLRLDEGGEDIVLPGAFLDLAERTGLIQDIDRWVVRTAIDILAAHRDEAVIFEVNLSGRAFADRQLLPMIQAELEVTGIDPSRLVLEVTETAAIANLDDALKFVRTLRSIGCGFALDDFGVGFSSFSHLKHLPVDYLKIDGSFIRDLPRNATDQHLVRAIVAVAGGLGKRTIAEFVGDAETVRLLAEYGVDFAQGYHIGEPRPIEELLRRDDLAA
ncbi:MAG TPA: EAL domain-containing protein [Dehalococcoidia bacterium]|nr:EAL domain-containing protein [Dehalococcoidia bacterium]